ncbi:MAG: hypothetical protein ACK53Y_26555 [bacterium]
MSTKGVAVSIAGCRLTTGPPRFSFIGNPPGRPVQNPPSCAETAELLDADPVIVKSIHELKY